MFMLKLKNENTLILFFCLMLVLTCVTQEFTDDEATKIGSAATSTIQMGSHSEQSETSELYEDDNMSDALMEALDQAPNPVELRDRPTYEALFDPHLMLHVDACDRNYDLPCPTNFVIMELAKDHATCSPSVTYKGPCPEEVTFSTELNTRITKRNFAARCMANWACNDCERDFSVECPLLFQSSGNGLCSPTRDYLGPCKTAVTFWMHNEAMIRRWSARCKAYFPCGPVQDLTTYLKGISKEASLGRAALS